MTRLCRRAALRALAAGGCLGVAGCPLGAPTTEDPSGDVQGLDPTTSWPSVAFDAGHTAHNPSTVGPTADADVAWTYKPSGTVPGKPVVADGTLYVLTQTDLVALDAERGTERWRRENVEFPTDGPTVDGDAVYAVRNNRSVVAFDRTDGTERWRYDAGLGAGLGSLVRHGDALYVHSRTHLHAVDVRDGRRRWRVASAADQRTRPAVVGDTVYHGPGWPGGSPALVARSTADGTVRWRRDDVVTMTPLSVAEETIYLGLPEGRYGAFATADGTRRWRADLETLDRSRAPAATGDALVGAAPFGRTRCFEAADGSERWSAMADHRLLVGPTVVGETVYLGSFRGTVVGVSLADGTQRWRIGLPAAVVAPPIVVDGTAYVLCGDETLYAIR